MTTTSMYVRPLDVPSVRDETVRMWSSDAGRLFAQLDLKRSYDHDLTVSGYVDSQVRLLEMANLYWVSEPMGAVLQNAMGTLPPAIIAQDDLPSQSGFVVFETPLDATDSDEVDHRLLVHAIDWCDVTIKGRHVLRVGFYQATKTLPVASIAETLDLGVRRLYFLGASSWPFGTKADDFSLYYAPHDPTGTKRASWLEDRLLIHAFFLLIRQQVARVDTAAPTRQMVRAAERAKRPVPDVRIVTLREQRAAHEPTDSPVHKDWSHRWVVSAHWRQQWHPSEGRHVPTLILPYLKGPEDKPLVKRPTVHAWRR